MAKYYGDIAKTAKGASDDAIDARASGTVKGFGLGRGRGGSDAGADARGVGVGEDA